MRIEHFSEEFKTLAKTNLTVNAILSRCCTLTDEKIPALIEPLTRRIIELDQAAYELKLLEITNSLKR